MIRKLQQQVNQLQEQMQEKDKKIEKLNEQVQRLREEHERDEKRDGDTATQGANDQPVAASDADADAALNRAIEELGLNEPEESAGQPDDDIASARVGRSNFRLIDVSVDVLTAAGGSTAEDEALNTLQGGAHDPKRRGFTLQQAELSLGGAVDPFFYGEAHALFTEDVVELEEAFLVTQQMPFDLQLEAGYFLTESGRINPQHPHMWDWMDQPVINTRLFGGDGMRGTGARLGWLTPLPWFSELHLGMQNATGEQMASFRGEGLLHSHGGGGHGHEEEMHFEEGIGGRPIVERDTDTFEDFVYLMRWVNAWDLSDELSMQLGASALYGPNNTGPGGETWIYGGDLVMKWQPAGGRRGFGDLIWQTELMKRDFEAQAFSDPDEGLSFPAETLEDWGLYTQVTYGFLPDWSGGLRYEFASGSGASFEEGERISRQMDPFRNDRHRISPLLTWQATEFSRLRLQYNYDIADHLDGGDAHSVWLGLEVLFGSHPAHSY